MDVRDILLLIAGQLPSRLPVLIALVVGLALVAQRRTLPATSRKAALLGFALLLLGNLLGMLGWPLLQASIIDAAMSAAQIQMTFALLAVPLALLDAAGLVLLALAIVRGAR
ncbi:conserved membrane hypothetical protein [Luteimonas sp. 9C]|uniref:hypothetical protein n=1 Tax=Luteimonas sp. 9C TaxID=2653148 RepID=UPI0012F41DE1|nr:hypothetical protein [Luteimonas sp. 9C]VXC13275.1 conserved membrane hypothetical protein [Luteimonas sp. 9C]